MSHENFEISNSLLPTKIFNGSEFVSSLSFAGTRPCMASVGGADSDLLQHSETLTPTALFLSRPIFLSTLFPPSAGETASRFLDLTALIRFGIGPTDVCAASLSFGVSLALEESSDASFSRDFRPSEIALVASMAFPATQGESDSSALAGSNGASDFSAFAATLNALVSSALECSGDDSILGWASAVFDLTDSAEISFFFQPTDFLADAQTDAHGGGRTTRIAAGLIGGVVAAVLCLLIVVFLFVMFTRRRRYKSKESDFMYETEVELAEERSLDDSEEGDGLDSDDDFDIMNAFRDFGEAVRNEVRDDYEEAIW